MFFLKNKKKSHKLAFIIILLFTAFRFNVGFDFETYYVLATKNEFKELSLFMELDEILRYIQNNIKNEIAWIFYRIELINRVIYMLIWKFNLPAQIIIIFYSFFTLFLIKKGLDNEGIFSKNVWLIYFAFPQMWLSHVSIMRQGLATGLIFYGYKYIKQRKFLKYCILVFIATLVHKSAGIMILLYPLQISLHFFNRIVYLLLFLGIPIIKNIIFYLIISFDIPIVKEYKYFILNKVGKGGEKVFYIMLVLYFLVLCAVFIDKVAYLKNKYLITVVIIGIILYLGLFEYGHTGPRMAGYFLIFLLYLVPWIEHIFKRLKIPLSLIGLSMLLILILALYVDTQNLDRSQYIPYKVFFIDNIDLN